jgi:predicted nucleic acid-binding protein
MKVLIDTNVALDYMLQRKDYPDAKTIFIMAEKNFICGFISASAITDIFYIAKSTLGKQPTKESLKKLLQVFRPATVTDAHIYQALNLSWDDFEDSVQYVVGDSFNADYIVTRNTQDYSLSAIPAIMPDQFIKQILQDDEEEEGG